LYSPSEITENLHRYENLRNKFLSLFGRNEVVFFSAPGRTELGGNHTDHNKGVVLAASVNLDTLAAVSLNDDNRVVLYSDRCDNEPVVVNLNDLGMREEESGTLISLVRGVAKYLNENHRNVGGFNAVITSDILFGAGLSSSASIEVLIGEIFNVLFNGGEISKETIARAGQFAENNYFGKPCGLMDQLACAYGGIIKIDFEKDAEIEKINFDFESTDYALLVVNTGGNHADLTEDYAAVPREMREVATFFGKEFLRNVNESDFWNSITELHKKVSARAILRAAHFFEENRRVEKQAEALKKNDFPTFLRLVSESGNSSMKKLQNLFPANSPEEQSLLLAVVLSEKFLENKNGVVRVHGGGFAGTIQVYLPREYVRDYKNFIEEIFGDGAATELKIRGVGVVQV
jgi:galactokinase